MIDRRDLILGGGLLAAAGGAFALTPRNRVEYLGKRKLESVVPTQIGPWTVSPSEAFVLPKTPGSLADRLYNDTVGRLYVAPDKIGVMMVLAYGSLQSDLLQLHRPETCYAAVGFQISASDTALLPLGNRFAVPVRELTASAENRVEPIVYWTRIGDDLPTDGSQQRRMRLRQQFAGLIPDGILVRLSTVGEASPETFAALREFGRAFVLSVKPADRSILVGPTLANGLRGVGL